MQTTKNYTVGAIIATIAISITAFILAYFLYLSVSALTIASYEMPALPDGCYIEASRIICNY